MKVIIVTGTPGTGKTAIAKKTAKEKSYKYVDVNKIIERKKLREKYDKKRQTYDVNIDKLNIALVEKINEEKKKKTKGLVIDSHLSHYLSPNQVNLCIVTKTDLGKLKKRLEKRNYSKAKIKENLDAEIFDVCLNEAKEAGHKIKIVEN